MKDIAAGKRAVEPDLERMILKSMRERSERS
jgi:hypothetical protein